MASLAGLKEFAAHQALNASHVVPPVGGPLAVAHEAAASNPDLTVYIVALALAALSLNLIAPEASRPRRHGFLGRRY